MEIGNALFGNSRGTYSIERWTGFEEELLRLYRTCTRNNNVDSYGIEYENDVFHVSPYYWGDCTCSYEENADEWDRANQHRPDCYQIQLKTAVQEYDNQIGYQVHDLFDAFNVDMMQSNATTVYTLTPRQDIQALAILHSKFQDKTSQSLCHKYGLTYPDGAAIHCTCDYQQKWDTWNSENDHDSGCLSVRPNFRFKPTGFEIRWYKYALRDAYMNQKINLKEFQKIIDRCVESVKER